MANAAKMSKALPVRMMVVGNPKSGKTGSLVSLINAGFKLRILDFDGNHEPLLLYANPDKLENVDIVYFEDKLRSGAQFMEPVGIPTAFGNALKMMDHWAYTDTDGTEVDLGYSKDWGLDTILVLDSLTKMGDAAFRRAQKLLNKTAVNTTQQVWMLAMSEQAMFIEKVCSNTNKFHVLVLAHLKMISPKDVQKGDSNLTADLKERIAEVIPTKLYPRALGQELPQVIGGEFPTLVQLDTKFIGTTIRRVLRTIPQSDLDLGVPHPSVPAELDIKDGMLTLFKALSPASVALVSGNAGTPSPNVAT